MNAGELVDRHLIIEEPLRRDVHAQLADDQVVVEARFGIQGLAINRLQNLQRPPRVCLAAARGHAGIVRPAILVAVDTEVGPELRLLQQHPVEVQIRQGFKTGGLALCAAGLGQRRFAFQ